MPLRERPSCMEVNDGEPVPTVRSSLGPTPVALGGASSKEWRLRWHADERDAYRELARAGLMGACHTFTGGRESLYRLTEEAYGRREELLIASALSCGLS